MTKMKSVSSIFIAIALLITPTLGARLGFCAAPIIKCTDVQTINFGPDVTVNSAKLVAATATLPDHCRVEGVREPEDGFIFKLPSVWNARYLQTGNGGAAGSYYETQMDPALGLGYAVGSGTGGHINPNMMDFSFGYHWWDDSAALVKVEDYCYGSIHKTNLLARKMIKAYYGIDPNYAYYSGYSTGGRQALMEAQRFPWDFNGIMGGDGPIPFTKRTMGDTWEATQFLGTSYIPITKLPLLADAVMKKCDSIDGLVDGLIDDPRKCTFNALTDLPACPGDVETSTCFTTAQRQAAYNVYDGIRDSTGNLLFKGVSYGSEAITADGSSGWTMFVPATPGGGTVALGLGSSFVQWVGLPPEKGGPGWDWKTFNVNTDWDIEADNWGAICDTYDPDLSSLKSSGGKMIYYHGWADALCWPNPAPDYYDQVVKKTGSLGETQEFFRLYMIPGWVHFPGLGRGVFDSNTIWAPLFGALVDWVEKGIEPGALVGSRPAVKGLWDAITRPICPYPEVARYLGTGSTDDAANFACVEIIPARVRITPAILKLSRTKTFTAFVKLPKGYHAKDWKISAVVSEGAPAVKLSKIGDTITAKFETQDLINITPGDEVTFTVSVIAEHGGQQIAFEGSDTVKVLE